MTNLKAERIKNGLKQCELAGLTDISPVILSKYENGWQKPSHGTAEKLAEALNCTVEDLYPGIKLYRCSK